MGKKSKRHSPRNVPSSTGDENDFLRLLDSLENRPSSIHGLGVFSSRPIKAGSVFKASGWDLSSKFLGMMWNATSVPPWRNILITTLLDHHEHARPREFQALDERSLLALREAWLDYVERDESKITSEVDMASGDVTVTIDEDLAKDEEILRPYGHEWLSIKYYHLMACYYQSKSMEDKLEDDQALTSFIDMNLLDMQRGTMMGDSVLPEDADIPAPIREEAGEGKDLVAVSSSDVLFFADCIKYLAESLLGKGQPHHEYHWASTLIKIKQIARA